MRTKITSILLLSMFGCAPIAGCRCIWTDDLFAIGLFTDIQTENSQLISEPNRLEIQAGSYGSDAQSIAVEVDPVSRVLRLVTD